MTKETWPHQKRMHEANSSLNFHLEVFGDSLALREGYKGLDGIDAIRFYLIHKFSWLPRDVNSMSYEEMRFVLSEELQGWTLPAEARS